MPARRLSHRASGASVITAVYGVHPAYNIAYKGMRLAVKHSVHWDNEHDVLLAHCPYAGRKEKNTTAPLEPTKSDGAKHV